MRLRFLRFFCLTFFFGLSVISVEAAPTIRVIPVWRPPSQLSSIDADGDGVTDSGDDIRYVTVDIFVNSDVEFWAVGMTCTLNKALLEAYNMSGDPNSLEDNVAMVDQGTAWVGHVLYSNVTVNTDGKISFAISASGDHSAPLGHNGFMETLHIATMKFRVREDITTGGTSSLQCTSNFLNRDGRRVLAASYTAPPPLSIMTGYTFSGNLSYQGIITRPSPAQAIEIQCDNNDADVLYNNVTTTAAVANGRFSVSNLRTQGRYDCLFVPHILNNAAIPDAIHLTGRSDFNLSTSTFAMLPIVLKGGNVETSTTPNVINSYDTVMVTSNWNAPQSLLTAPYMFGDATGDRKINEMDLAVVSSNSSRQDSYLTDHIIYSLARDASSSFNNHLWLGSPDQAAVSAFGPVTSRDYWPAISPNGTRIVFVRNVGTGAADKFALFIAPISDGVMGTASRLTAISANYDAFAPSWSMDGSQLAFVCSYEQDWATNSEPIGYICLMDANGSNFRLLIRPATQAPIRTKIQAAAWVNSQLIYFPYASDPAAPHSCDNALCLLNLAFPDYSRPSNIPLNTDMPYVRNTLMGLTLFYHYDNGPGARSVRYATLNVANANPQAVYPFNANPIFHLDVTGASFINAAYFTVSTGADPDIFFYNDFPSSDDAGGSDFTTIFFGANPASPSWYTVSVFSNYSISDGMSNPAFASGYNDVIPNTAAYLP